MVSPGSLAFLLLAAGAGALVAAAIAAWRIHGLREGERRLLHLVDERTAELEERTAQLEIANDLLQHLATIDDLTNVANARPDSEVSPFVTVSVGVATADPTEGNAAEGLVA